MADDGAHAATGGAAATMDGDVEELVIPRLDVDADRAVRKMERAKRKGRPELRLPDWYRNRLEGRSEEWMPPARPPDDIPRIDYDQVSEAEFIERFERPGKPCVIRGALDRCGARKKWTLEELYEKYGDIKFKVGEDDDGYKVMVKLKYFLHYLTYQRDDSPLYAFDSSFADHAVKKALCQDYEVPKYFRDDLFKLCGESRRPPYRWFLIGPARSGTGMHTDPLATSAWNALIYGRKRWVIFPPDTPKAALRTPGGDSEAIHWFTKVLPRAKEADWPHHPPIEFIQYPGETVFVPGGWHHTVLNIDTTVAVTQNFCSRINFKYVWPRTVRGRPKLSKKMLAQLKIHYPELAEYAATVDPYKPDDLPMSSSSDSSSSSSSESEEEPEESQVNRNPNGEHEGRKRKKCQADEVDSNGTSCESKRRSENATGTT